MGQVTNPLVQDTADHTGPFKPCMRRPRRRRSAPRAGPEGAGGLRRGGVGPGATLNALVGPIVYCALTGSSIPRGLVDTLVEDVLRPRSK